jgi:hypothetical protein
MISSTLSKPMTIQAGEHPRSAARGKGFPKSTGLFASPLHRLVIRKPSFAEVNP